MRDFRKNRNLVRGVFLIWMAAVVAAYYVVHKPFSVGNVLALGEALAALGGASAVIALGTGVGLLLLRRIELNPVERVIWAAGLGLGVVSLVGLGLGAIGLLHPWALWVLGILGLTATGAPLWRALQDACSDLSWRPEGRLEAILAGYCGLTLVAGLIWALTPPTAWDALVYHLTGPKLYLTSGRVSHSLDLPYLGFPQLTEMLFTWGMGLAGERAAAVIHWFSGALTVLALVSAGRRSLGGRSGWLAAAILLSGRTMVMLLGWPYVDLALLLYTTLAFLAVAQSTEQRTRRWLTISGASTGLALSTKYTALALLPALVVALLAFEIRDRKTVLGGVQNAARQGLTLCAVALLVWTPWLAKNLLLTGNPTYPFFFDGIHWDEWRSWWYDRPGTGLAWTTPWRLLSAPWDATIWGIEGGTGYSATIGPLFLALLPLVLLAWRRFTPKQRQWVRAAIAFCTVLYGFWSWGVARTALLRQTRLLFPAFGLLALMAGAAVEILRVTPSRAINLGWLCQAILLVVLLLTLIGFMLSGVEQRPLQVLLGFESEADFSTRQLGWHYVVMEHIERELSPKSVVLFLWEPRSYYCSADCRPDALLDRWLHTVHLYGRDAQAIAEAWRAEGVTHVLIHQSGLNHIVDRGFDPVRPDDLQVLDELRTEHLTLVKSFGSAYDLFRWEQIP